MQATGQTGSGSWLQRTWENISSQMVVANDAKASQVNATAKVINKNVNQPVAHVAQNVSSGVTNFFSSITSLNPLYLFGALFLIVLLVIKK